MANLEILFFYTIINFIGLLLAYKFFGKKGIYIFIVISVIAANIQVNKGVEYNIGGFHIITTLGNVMFSGIFMANDLINEKYGKYEARQAVLKSIFFGLLFVFLMFFATLFNSIDSNFYNKTNNAFDTFFSINGGALKAVIIGNIVYLISQLFDVFIYSKIRKRFTDMKWLWLRNTGSTLISQIIDTSLITLGLALANIIPTDAIFEIIISTLIIKYIISLINAPLFYILVFIKPRKTL